MDRDPSCYEHHEVAVGPDCKHTQSNHAQLKLRALSADEHRLQRSSELRVHTEADRDASSKGSLSFVSRTLTCTSFPALFLPRSPPRLFTAAAWRRFEACS
jgi:hypothetical protein